MDLVDEPGMLSARTPNRRRTQRHSTASLRTVEVPSPARPSALDDRRIPAEAAAIDLRRARDHWKEVGAPYEMYVLEDYGARPMFELPPSVRAAFEESDVSIYAGQPKPGAASGS